MGVPSKWEIPAEIRARLSDRHGRQRTMVADGHIVVVLHRAPRAADHRRAGVLFWRHSNGRWECSESTRGLANLNELIDQYSKAVAHMEDECAEAVDAEGWYRVLAEAGPLCRASRNLYESLQQARQAIPDVQQRAELQGPCDVASDIARASELLQTDATNALEFHVAKQSEIQAKHSRELARASHRLNILASIFLPLMCVATVFGMNLKHGLEESPSAVFWTILSGGILLGVIISSLLLNFGDVNHRDQPRRYPDRHADPGRGRPGRADWPDPAARV